MASTLLRGVRGGATRRVLAFAAVSLGFVANMVVVLIFFHEPTDKHLDLPSRASPSSQRLAVVVPTHLGDYNRALASMTHWPESCSTRSRHMELVLYLADSVEDAQWSDKDLALLAATGGRCFDRTSVIFANLSIEDNVYPKGASVQFYKLFLDETIRDSLRRFQAIAILEWDVIVADDNSFDMMHRAAFDGLDEYWVKGASLAGVNFHETALLWHQWCILGHINGNAIYSNSDPAFVEFLEFTLARWEYAYSYDVALWATIADFPYSWPLWQRFSSKFVSSKLIANMGFEDVSESTIRKAVDSGTMFIHGNRASGGSEQYHQNEGGPHHVTPLGGSVNCTVECGSESSTVCDDTCLAAEHDQDDYRRLLCGAGDVPRYGPHCRQCFTEADEAAIASRANDGSDEHVIMCHTKRPPPSGNCSMECAENAQTMCDTRCGSGYAGDFNCNWRDGGRQCRFCFEDSDDAIRADAVAKAAGGRVIMCNTREPPRDTRKSEGRGVVNAPVGKRNIRQLTASTNGTPKDDEALPPSMIPYARNLVRGELCAFTLGHLTFLDETMAGVRSLAHFMPGVQVVVGVDPENNSAFRSALDIYPDVKVVSTTTLGGHASLFADVFCGEDTKLIFYLGPGEVITRTFTKKDTHGTNGDLLVSFRQREGLGEFYLKRSLATTSVFGFAAPSFSYGADIIMPSWLNYQLRRILLPDTVGVKLVLGRVDPPEQMVAISHVQAIDDAYVPELLAGLAYSRNVPGMWFVDPKEWVTRHAFLHESVWSIPLVKPRFSCATNIALAQQGYDVAYELNRFVDSSERGTAGDGQFSCETGYLDLDVSRLRPKAVANARGQGNSNEELKLHR